MKPLEEVAKELAWSTPSFRAVIRELIKQWNEEAAEASRQGDLNTYRKLKERIKVFVDGWNYYSPEDL